MIVLGVNGPNKSLNKTIRIPTDKPDNMMHVETTTETHIKNVEGFDVPTTPKKDVFVQIGMDEDTAIPQSVDPGGDGVKLTSEIKTIHPIDNEDDKIETSFMKSTTKEIMPNDNTDEISMGKDTDSDIGTSFKFTNDIINSENDLGISNNIIEEDGSYKDPKMLPMTR